MPGKLNLEFHTPDDLRLVLAGSWLMRFGRGNASAAVGGLVLSFGIDFPSGATIVLVLACLYLATALLQPWIQGKGGR